MKTRGFEVLTAFQNKGIQLPQRQTYGSAGYDLQAAEDVDVPSIWTLNFVRIFRMIRNGHPLTELDFAKADQVLKPIMVPTGLKAYFPEDEFLLIANRSSNSWKRYFTLANAIGVVDSDYYNNDDNEGALNVQIINFGVRTLHIKKGERIAQAMFIKTLRVDNDQPVDRQRKSGFGSTNGGADA
ncbi:MAG: dUTP diphosphatase [Lactobacillus sp.]|nr:dUTP diphosphatase [Lactobacillus sp.]